MATTTKSPLTIKHLTTSKNDASIKTPGCCQLPHQAVQEGLITYKRFWPQQTNHPLKGSTKKSLRWSLALAKNHSTTDHSLSDLPFIPTLPTTSTLTLTTTSCLEKANNDDDNALKNIWECPKIIQIPSDNLSEKWNVCGVKLFFYALTLLSCCLIY